MAKGKKKGATKRRSTGSKGWMDKAKLAGGLAAVVLLTVTSEKWQDGKSLNPFKKTYWTNAA